MSLGNFSISRELGQGGMATVFLAEDKKFDTFVAIKLLKKEFVANENIRKRFVAEAKNMYRMSHPNIIKVTDLIDEGDTIAFVMEYIEGETLKEFLDRKGRLSDGEIKSIFTQMLEAVSYVHEQNLVHRDIKPSNFMVDKKGKVKLMDFGIAKNTDSNSTEYTITGTGMQMGTPMYMSPEQIKSTKEVSAASDIYSLGVVLWQLVMGKKPYEGDTLSTFEIQLKIVQQTLDPTQSLWDAFIQKATAKNEQDRYASCSAWLSELNNGVQDSPASAKNEATVIERFDATDKTVIEQDLNKDIMLVVSMLAPDGTLKYGFVDVKGNWLIQAMFDSVGHFDEQGFCNATINSKEGYIDKKGNWKIQPIFDRIYYFDDYGFAEATLNGRVGFIDRSGNWVVQPVFDSFKRFNERGYCPATVNGKEGIINKDGNWVAQPIFDHVSYADDEQGYHEVELNGKFGFIDERGHWMIHAKFDMLRSFDEEGYATGCIGEKWGYIDRKGNWIIQPLFDDVTSFENQGYAQASLNGKWGHIDRKGNWIFQPKFDSVWSFEDQDLAQASLGEKRGFIDKKGNWIIKPIFDDAGYFDEQGFAPVSLNKKWGFIDRNGNWIIQPIFDETSWFSFDDQGFAKACLNGKFGFIDRKGNWIIQPMYDAIGWSWIGFDEQGCCEVQLEDSEWGMIDRKGNWIIQPEFLLKKAENNWYRVSKENKFGFKDATGNWKLEPKFDYIQTDFEGDPMVWNEETKDWDIQSSSESDYSDIDDETIEGYFSHLVGKEKVFLSNNLPFNKLKNFIIQFNKDWLEGGEVLVYFDDTLWGKGDNGFLILRWKFDSLYLFVSDFAGEKLCFCWKDDGVYNTLLSSSYNVKDKKLQIAYQDQAGDEKLFVWFNSNPATLALDTFIQENT